MQQQEKEIIEKIAQRIVQYYHQIIAIKKEQGIKTFIIDSFEPGRELSLSWVSGKYDGQGYWRSGGLGITRDDNWHTLGGAFRDAFGDSQYFYIDGSQLFQKISLLLSKEGIANYFSDEYPEDLPPYFSKYRNEKLLYVVL